MDTKINDYMYKTIDVWKRIDDKSAVKYRCFQIAGENKYCVQNADFFHHPIDEKQLYASEKNCIELFIEDLPQKRTKMYSSLKEAIENHDIEFGNFEG